MDPRWKITTGVDVEKLSEFYGEKSFDMVQCMETLEHVRNSDKALEELAKVAKKLVILSSCDEGHHIGIEQDALEKIKEQILNTL
jgi:2-polyprenyl-3-methyl-5-hydroxy-6-metoxy-1,4-benzoquinol methylase